MIDRWSYCTPWMMLMSQFWVEDRYRGWHGCRESLLVDWVIVLLRNPLSRSSIISLLFSSDPSVVCTFVHLAVVDYLGTIIRSAYHQWIMNAYLFTHWYVSVSWNVDWTSVTTIVALPDAHQLRWRCSQRSWTSALEESATGSTRKVVWPIQTFAEDAVIRHPGLSFNGLHPRNPCNDMNYYSFTDSGETEGRVGLVVWPMVDTAHEMVTCHP